MDVAGFKKTFAIDQGTVLGMDSLFQALFNAPLTDPKRDGICTGLSMIWLARRMMFHSEDAALRLEALTGTKGGAAFRWGGKTQDTHLAAGAGSGTIEQQFQAMYGDALKPYVLRIKTGTAKIVSYTDQTGTATAFAGDVSKPGRYILYNLGLRTTTGSAGHMVASYASKGKHFYFFDPNMGEYKIGSGEVQTFLKAFFDSYLGVFQGINYFSDFEVIRG